MADSKCHLAQFNIARLAYPLESPKMAEFVSALDVINKVADRSPGFIWRQKGDDGGPSTSIRPLGDEFIISFSVWESIDHFKAFVYRSEHRKYLMRRREWFSTIEGENLVMWWVPRHHIPTVEEAVQKFELLIDVGPTPQAFNFAHSFLPAAQEYE